MSIFSTCCPRSRATRRVRRYRGRRRAALRGSGTVLTDYAQLLMIMSSTIGYLTSRSTFLQVSPEIPVTKSRNPDKFDPPEVFEGASRVLAVALPSCVLMVLVVLCAHMGLLPCGVGCSEPAGARR